MKLTSQIIKSVCLAASLAVSLTARATTYTWTGAGFLGDQDYLWSNPFNWAGLAAPSAGETNVALIFPNNASPKTTTNDLVGLSVVSVWFAGSNYVVHGKPGGNILTLQGNPGGGWVVLASFNGSSFATTCPLSLNSTGTVAVPTGVTLTMNSQMFGTGGFTKTSPGTLKLQAATANLYSGTTAITDGTLDLNNTGNAIPGPLVIGGTNLSVSPVVRLLANNQIANTSTITIHEDGQLWLNSHDDTLGSLTLYDGAVVSTGVGGGSSSPGTLTLSGNITNWYSVLAPYAEIDGKLSLASGTRYIHADGWLRVYADISGSGGLTKTGDDYLSISGATNSYTGATVVQEGVLHVADCGSPLGTAAAGTTISSSGSLYTESSDLGTESLTLNGGASWTMEFRGTNVCAGPVSLNGACELHNQDWGDPGPADITFSGAISGTGSLHKTGDGYLHFTGLGGNTFTGGLYCEAGFTYFEKSASAPALAGPLVVGHQTPGNYAVAAVRQLNQIPNSIPISLIEYGSLDAENGATDTLGPIEFSGGILYAGSGVFTLGGDVTNHSGLVPTVGIYGDVVLSGERNFHCDANTTLPIASPLAGSGDVTKTGPGELALQGACTYSGVTVVNQGTLTLEYEGRPGSSASTTTIYPDGVLRLNGANVTNEIVFLFGGGTDNGVALIHHNTNVWAGTVEIHDGAVFKAEPVANTMILGTIQGDGGLDHIGDGTLTLGGAANNTFSGLMRFRQGTLQLAKSGAFAMPVSLILGYASNGAPASVVRMLAANQFNLPPGSTVGLNPGASLDCNGFNQTVANLDLTDATVGTGVGILSLQGQISVSTLGGTYSYLYGNLRLVNNGAVNTHLFNIQTNAVVWQVANLSESGAQNITKLGPGQWLDLGDVGISGTLSINGGRWFAGGSNPFGTAGAPTIVNAGASLFTFAGTFAEPLQLAGSGDGGAGALYSSATNSFTGPITLNAGAVVLAESNAIVTFSGGIGGPGGLTKDGGGLLKLTGTDANTFAGDTLVNRGKLELGKTGVTAIPGALATAGNSGANGVRLLLPNQIADAAPVTLGGGDFLDLNGNAETIGSLAGTGALLLGSGTLNTGGNNATTSLSGSIGGSGGLTKTGTGTFSLLAPNSYTGTTTINGGTLLVFGQQPSSPVSINTGGTLGGTGRVGNISDLNGHISPGASPGILVCSNYSTFTPANLLQIEIAGATPGSGHDQLQVNGTVLLMGGTLQVGMNFAGAISNQYVIVSNDVADAVSGTFTGLPEGAMLTNNGVIFQITYHGGDGNDIALIQKTVVTGPQITGIQPVGPGRILLSATGLPNTTYSVQAATNLIPPVVWTVIGSAASDGAGLLSFLDGDAGNYPMRFYRFGLP